MLRFQISDVFLQSNIHDLYSNLLSLFMTKKPTTYVFIDSQNLHLGIKGLGWKLDYQRFNVYLKQKYNASKIIMYIGYISKYKKLYDYLTQCGYQLVYKNTKRIGKNKNDFKGNIDVDLTVDVIRNLKKFNHAIFVSADGDFCPLYDYLIEKNKKITILIPNQHLYSKFLFKYQNRLKFMNDLKQKLGQK